MNIGIKKHWPHKWGINLNRSQSGRNCIFDAVFFLDLRECRAPLPALVFPLLRPKAADELYLERMIPCLIREAAKPFHNQAKGIKDIACEIQRDSLSLTMGQISHPRF